MLTLAAKIWGWIFLVIGILGFVPAVTPDGHLLGLFHVNAVHNVVHLLTGVIALWVGYTSPHASKLYFLTFGIIYGIVAIIGFVTPDRAVFGIIANNIADAWLHAVIAIVAILLGLVPETVRVTPKQPAM